MIYDDLDLSILKYKEESDKIYKLSNYKTKPFKYQEEGNKRKINFTPHSMYKADFKIETAFTQNMVSGYFFKYKKRGFSFLCL